MRKILFLYAFYQKDLTYLQNLMYFIENGLNKHRNTSTLTVHYIIVINGTMAFDLSKLISENNVKLITRENKDFDFGAYIHVLNDVARDPSAYWNMHPSEYDFSFYMNASVRGPFLPEYYSGHFLEPFLGLFTSQDVHLVGTTINVLDMQTNPHSYEARMFHKITNGEKPPYTHVQSMFFGMDKECFSFLKNYGFWSLTKDENRESVDFVKFIAEREIMMSFIVLKKANWNISAILREYRGHDYRTVRHDFNQSSITGDPCFRGACFGRTIHPYEVIFIKTNRDISTESIQSLSQRVKVPYKL